jgi:hypothetical protein
MDQGADQGLRYYTIGFWVGGVDREEENGMV